MNAAVGEIKKLNEQLSQLRQENIVLKVSLSSSVETIVGVLEGLFSSSSDFGRYKLLKENQTWRTSTVHRDLDHAYIVWHNTRDFMKTILKKN